MFLELAFDRKTEVSLFDSNYGLFDENRFFEAEKNLKFKLFENSGLSKFLNIYEAYKNTPQVEESQKGFRYNYYIKQTQDDYLEGLQKLNTTIDEINSFGLVKIDSTLKISLSNEFEKSKKLNELHVIFELSLTQQSVVANQKLHQKLWILNNLIHSLENIEPYGSQRSWYMVTNLHSHLETPWNHRIEQLLAKELEPTDFKNFDWPQESFLYLDYASIGKDLMDCFYSNDLELVKSGGVKQQQVIKAGFAFEMNTARTSVSTVKTHQQYEKWLNQNNISKYLNLAAPQYTVGRLKIGQLIDFPYTDWNEFWDYNYSLAGFKITL